MGYATTLLGCMIATKTGWRILHTYIPALNCDLSTCISIFLVACIWGLGYWLMYIHTKTFQTTNIPQFH